MEGNKPPVTKLSEKVVKRNRKEEGRGRIVETVDDEIPEGAEAARADERVGGELPDGVQQVLHSVQRTHVIQLVLCSAEPG